MEVMKFDQKQDDPERYDDFSYCYGQLKHQQIMLEDHVRMNAYQKAILHNKDDFQGKVVMDVGAGTGILSFFSLQAGARKVYAVEASNMANYAEKLMKSNIISAETKRCKVIHSKLEDMNDIEYEVDILVSEPMGFCLVHERMLETFIKARDKFLNLDQSVSSGVRLFPSSGTIYVAPFNDYELHSSQHMRTEFWSKTVCDYDFTCLHQESINQSFSQAFMGAIHPSSLVSDKTSKITFDFKTITIPELRQFQIDCSFVATRTTLVHGLASWFSVDLSGSSQTVILSTDPSLDTTHWYQTRFLFVEPLAVNKGQSMSGVMSFCANEHHSYDIDMKLQLDGSDVFIRSNHIWLHEQAW